MQNEALEAALALYRAPTERFTLSHAELPRDIGFALRLASAPQPLLQEIAAEFGEDETILLEAIRFYLQLMLFQPEANAYRVLGLPADAPQRQVREHYRWLQRWLHPDRHGDNWESLYAPRVNWAWNHLHSERSRHAYDAQPIAYSGEDIPASAPERVPFRPDWMQAQTPRVRMSFGQRIALALLIGSCGALLYVASTRQDAPPADALGHGGIVDNAALSTMPENGNDSGPTLAQVRKALERQPQAPIEPTGDRAEPAGATAADGTKGAGGSGSSGTPAPPAAAAQIAGKAQAERPALPKASAAQPDALAASQGDSVTAPAALPIAAAQPEPASAAHVEHPTGSAGALPDEMALQRAGLARNRVQELSQFFGAPDLRIPPIWNDAQGQTAAERERHRLHQRVGWDGKGDFSVEAPVWRLSGSLASLDAAYRLRKGPSVSESGRLTLRMVWREEMWLVTQVALEPAP